MRWLFNWINRLENSAGEFVIRYRFALIAAFLILTALAALGFPKIQIDPSYRIYMDKEDPELISFDRMENEYAVSEGLLIMLDFKQEGSIFTRENLKLIHELTENAWYVPYVSRVDSLTNFQHITADGDTLVISDLVLDPEALTDDDIQQVKEVALSESSLQRMMVDPKGRAAAVVLTVKFPTIDEALYVREIAEHVSEIQKDIENRHPNVTTYLNGRPVLDYGMDQQIAADIQLTLPSAGALILALMWFLSRSFWGTLFTTAIIVISVGAATGMSGHLGLILGAPNVFAPIIILTIAAASCVHVLMTFLNQYRMGETKENAIKESLRTNLQPVALTGITTTIGFLSILQSTVPAFSALGAIAALGILYATTLALLFLPALLSFLPDRSSATLASSATSDSSKPKAGLGIRLSEGLGRWVVANRWLSFIVASLIIGSAISGIGNNNVNEYLNEFLREDQKERQAIEFGIEHLAGASVLQFELLAPAADGVFDPRYLTEADQFVQWLYAQPEVIHVASITDVMKRLNKNMHGGDESWYRIPDDIELSAQYFLLYELSLPYGMDVTNMVNLDRSATRIVVNISNLDTTSIREFVNRTDSWLMQNMDYVDSSPTQGLFAILSRLSQENATAMLTITAIALVGISAILILMLGSLRMGMISLIPNLIPAAMGFGLWGYIDGNITMPLSLVATMTMGIIVDDTVHFLSKYSRARRELTLEVDEAIVYCFKTVGQALIVTSLMLIAGFVVLMFSFFPGNVEVGTLTSMVIAFALLADFFFLPPILLWLDKNEKQPSEVSSVSL